MSFIVQQIQQFGMVVIIMACALLGTIGIIKMIGTIFHVDGFGISNNNQSQKKKQDRDGMEQE